MSSLFAPGITSLRDMPHTHHRAISLGLVFLSFEQLPKDEQPRRSIWFNGDAMREHWEAVEARREEKWGNRPEGSAPPADDKDMARNSFLDDFYVK